MPTTTTRQASECCASCGERTCDHHECLERPRFFGGQLLTQNELNSMQDYLRAKNKLHNRMLHGWGTVCGLEVSCHPCAGWLRIHPGYAIDPCGNDILVCDAHDLDLAAAIRDCIRQARREECASGPSRRKDPDVAERWCIRLRYVEEEVRPISPLRRDASGSCSCGEGRCGTQGGCRCAPCGGCGRKEPQCVCPPSRRREAIECEPTRTRETYRVEVCRSTDGCADSNESAEATLWSRIGDCVKHASKVLRARIPDSVSDPSTAAEAYTYAQALRDAVARLYRDDPHGVRCGAADEVDAIDLLPPLPDEDTLGWLARNTPPLQVLSTHLFQYFLDCVCNAVLPPCPPDPEDTTVCLACVRFDPKSGAIEHICNLSCRRFAGSFQSQRYWLPIGAALGPLLCRLCCEFDLLELLGVRPKPNREMVPEKSLQANMAMVSDFGGLPERFTALTGVARSIASPASRFGVGALFPALGGVAEATVPDSRRTILDKAIGRGSDAVINDLEAHGVAATRHAIDELPMAERAIVVSAPSTLPEDARVEVFHGPEGRVVGWRVRRVRDDLADTQRELVRMRRELEELRSGLGAPATATVKAKVKAKAKAPTKRTKKASSSKRAKKKKG